MKISVLLSLGVSLVSVAAFVGMLYATKVVAVFADVMRTIGRARETFGDETLEEREKEANIQRLGLQMLRLATSFALRFFLILAAAYLPILGADASGLVSESAVLSLMLRWEYILAVTVVLVAAFRMGSRFRRR